MESADLAFDAAQPLQQIVLVVVIAGSPVHDRDDTCQGYAGQPPGGIGRQNESVSDLAIEDFIRLETEVWRALVSGDAVADARLLAEDFLGVYPTGFADRSDHVGQLNAGPTVDEFTLSHERLLVLSDSVVLLAYRADYRRAPRAEGTELETMYVSSLWCRRGGRWVNVFSQDTPPGPSTV
jgi:hypothetical protein